MRLLRWIVVVAIVVALVFAARPYVRGLSFVVRDADLQGTPRQLADLNSTAVRERDIDIPADARTLRARVYESTAPRGRAALAIPPPGGAGIDGRQVVALARSLAASGLTVVTPAIPDLLGYELVPGATSDIERAAVWLASQPSFSHDRKVGIVGIGFSGGLSVVVAGRATLADRVAFVLTIDGHHDLPRVLRYLCTGSAPRPGQQIRLTDADRSTFVGTPGPAGVGLVLAGLAPRVVPPAQAPQLRSAVLQFLDADAARGGAGDSRDEGTGGPTRLPEPSATLVRYLRDGDIVHLGARLLPHVAAYGGDAALSPSRSPKPKAPVFVLHDSSDHVIPEVEAEFLADDLRGKAPVRTMTGTFGAGTTERPRGMGQILRLAGFWGDLLSR